MTTPSQTNVPLAAAAIVLILVSACGNKGSTDTEPNSLFPIAPTAAGQPIPSVVPRSVDAQLTDPSKADAASDVTPEANRTPRD
jgi:hypothetical protein